MAGRHELIPQCLDKFLSRASVFEFLNVLADVENNLCRAGEYLGLPPRSGGVKWRYFFIVIVEEVHGCLPGFLQPYQILRSGAFLRQYCAAFHSATAGGILLLVALGYGRPGRRILECALMPTRQVA